MEIFHFPQISYIHIKPLCLLWLMFYRWNGNLSRARSRFTEGLKKINKRMPLQAAVPDVDGRCHHISLHAIRIHVRFIKRWLLLPRPFMEFLTQKYITCNTWNQWPYMEMFSIQHILPLILLFNYNQALSIIISLPHFYSFSSQCFSA